MLEVGKWQLTVGKLIRIDRSAAVVVNLMWKSGWRSMVGTATRVAVPSDHFELGRLLLRVYEKELWKIRMIDGKVAYAGFNHFVKSEIGISHTTAYGLMDVAKYFTEDQAKRFGCQKLVLLLKAPEAKRVGLMEKIEDGISHRQLMAEVNTARREVRLERRLTGRRADGHRTWSNSTQHDGLFVPVASSGRPFRRRKFAADKCFYCRVQTTRIHREHVIPLSRGGIDSPINIVPACKCCNTSKGARLPSEWRSDLPKDVLDLEKALLEQHVNLRPKNHLT